MLYWCQHGKGAGTDTKSMLLFIFYTVYLFPQNPFFNWPKEPNISTANEIISSVNKTKNQTKNSLPTFSTILESVLQ